MKTTTMTFPFTFPFTLVALALSAVFGGPAAKAQEPPLMPPYCVDWNYDWSVCEKWSWDQATVYCCAAWDPYNGYCVEVVTCLGPSQLPPG
jgi:hypothetical protein